MTIFRDNYKKEKNILYVCESYGGGVKTHIDKIYLNHSDLSKFNFTVLISSKRIENVNLINPNFIIDDNLSFGRSFIKFFKALKNINRIVKENNIDIIHAHSTISGLLIFIYSFFNKKISYLYTPHGYYSLKPMNLFKKKVVQICEKWINSISDYVIHVSRSEEAIAINQKIVSSEKSVVIFNGVEDPCIPNKVFKYKKQTLIVNLARVEDQKNPFEFIEIAKKVIEKNDSVNFIWAGSGGKLTLARKRVEELNLSRRIKFIGFTNDVSRVLKDADIFFSTSLYEGLPFSVIEAASYKLPLVLSKVPGHIDLIESNKNGYYYNLGNIEEASNYLNKLVNSKDILEKISFNSYRNYKENYSIENMIYKLSNLYSNIKD